MLRIRIRNRIRIRISITPLAACLGLWALPMGCGTAEPEADPCAPDAELAPLQLAASHCVVRRLALASEPLALSFEGGQVWTFAQDQATQRFSIGSWQMPTADGESAGLYGLKDALSFVAADETFGTQYLARSAAGQLAAGYNTADFTDPQGEVFFGATGEEPKKVQANGNFDVVFLDETTLLVNGMGAGNLSGQAVYVVQAGKEPRKLIDQIGDNSGPLAIGSTALFAGGFYAADGKTKLFGFSRAEIEAAVASGEILTPEADGDLVASGGFLDVTTVEDAYLSLVLASYDAEFKFDGVSQVAVSVKGDRLIANPPSKLVTVPAGSETSVQRVASDGGRLGLLLVDARTSKAELALVKMSPMTAH